MTPSAILSAKTRSETRFIHPGPRPHTGFADTVRALPSNMRTGRSHILRPPLFPHSHPHPPGVGSHTDCPRLRYDRLAFRKRLRPKRSDRSSTEFLPENARRRTFPTPGNAPANHHWETGADACKSNKTLFGPSIPRRPTASQHPTKRPDRCRIPIRHPAKIRNDRLRHSAMPLRTTTEKPKRCPQKQQDSFRTEHSAVPHCLTTSEQTSQPVSNTDPSSHEDPQRPPPTSATLLQTTIGKPERMPAKATRLFSDRAFHGAPLLHNIRANVSTGIEYRSVILQGSGDKLPRHPRRPCEPPQRNRKDACTNNRKLFERAPLSRRFCLIACFEHEHTAPLHCDLFHRSHRFQRTSPTSACLRKNPEDVSQVFRQRNESNAGFSALLSFESYRENPHLSVAVLHRHVSTDYFLGGRI